MQGIQKRPEPQWFAYECPCTKGKLILHHFRCLNFVTAPEILIKGIDGNGEVTTMVEYMNFEIMCEKCEKQTKHSIAMENIDFFLDRLTPNCTHDPELRDQIVWYWKNKTEQEEE